MNTEHMNDPSYLNQVNYQGMWQPQSSPNQAESNYLMSSLNSLDHRSIGDSFEDMDSLSDISTEKSDSGDTENKSLKKPRKSGKASKGNESSVDQKTKFKNREHAKKTRIRKKNYIEALKQTVKQFSDEKERQDRDSRLALTRLAEQTRVRKQVLQTMFYFRAIAETNQNKWATILDDNFTLILPITPYRSFSPVQVINGQRMVHGVDGMIKDTASLRVLIQSIGQAKDDGQEVRMQYYSELEDGIMCNNSYMCRWLMKTENAVERGARQEVYKHGMVEAVFTPQNKLYRLEMAFDVMSFMQQLRRSSGRYDFQVVPNTLPLANSDESTDARIIVEAVEPYLITSANQNWCDLLGYRHSESIGRRFQIFCGVETELTLFQNIVDSIESGEATCTMISGHTADGSKLRLYIRSYPLYTNGFVTHYLCVFEQAFNFPSILMYDANNPTTLTNIADVNYTGIVGNNNDNIVDKNGFKPQNSLAGGILMTSESHNRNNNVNCSNSTSSNNNLPHNLARQSQNGSSLTGSNPTGSQHNSSPSDSNSEMNDQHDALLNIGEKRSHTQDKCSIRHNNLNSKVPLIHDNHNLNIQQANAEAKHVINSQVDNKFPTSASNNHKLLTTVCSSESGVTSNNKSNSNIGALSCGYSSNESKSIGEDSNAMKHMIGLTVMNGSMQEPKMTKYGNEQILNEQEQNQRDFFTYNNHIDPNNIIQKNKNTIQNNKEKDDAKYDKKCNNYSVTYDETDDTSFHRNRNVVPHNLNDADNSNHLKQSASSISFSSDKLLDIIQDLNSDDINDININTKGNVNDTSVKFSESGTTTTDSDTNMNVYYNQNLYLKNFEDSNILPKVPAYGTSYQPQAQEVAVAAANVIYGVLGDVSSFDWTDFLEEDNCYNTNNNPDWSKQKNSVPCREKIANATKPLM